jgi:hypothetical protein
MSGVIGVKDTVLRSELSGKKNIQSFAIHNELATVTHDHQNPIPLAVQSARLAMTAAGD